MGQDVKMKPANSVPPSILSQLEGVITSIEKGVAGNEMRLMARANRQMLAVRRQLKASTVTSILIRALPAGSDVLFRLLPFAAAVCTLNLAMASCKKILQQWSSLTAIDEHLVQIQLHVGAENLAYADERTERDMDVNIPPAIGQSRVCLKKSVLPEVEIFCYLLITIFLIDQKQLEEAKACSSAAVNNLQQLNRQTLDVLAARIYYYYSYSHELTDNLADIRGTLLALHETATLRHDELGQETLLNLLLRNYLHYNLYDHAEELRSKTQRSDSHSNQQLCRYLYYLGKIRTIQLEFTEAKDCLLQAARASARGFRIQCTKWAVIVRLLLGEIPERTTFMQPGMQKALRPYFELSNAVRIGDLELFRSVAEKHSSFFTADKSHNLIVRLRHNVIRTGLRNISIAYSRISLTDVATKLHLISTTPVVDAESFVTKAIRDGGIDVNVDHSKGWMQSKETGDVYSTQEPQQAFHSRIAFCLATQNEAVKALRFPPDAHKKELESAEKRRERQQQVQELANYIAEEEDDDDDFF